VRSITFPDGATAKVVEARADVDGDELVAALGLPRPRGTVVLNGSAAELDDDLVARLAAVVGGDGLAGMAVRQGLTAVTGGTDAGIFSILGRAMTARTAPLVGVAPGPLVTWPGRDARGVPLEPHHSHFVLVDGQKWGDETEVLLGLARALGAQAPSVAVICGGGPVTRKEVLGHVRDGRPVVVLGGSGRLADELADAAAGHGEGALQGTAEIAGSGTLTVCPLSDGAGALVDAVLAALAGSTGGSAG
jgi:hypothetical protein